jgi:hypothetical protein
VGNDNIQGTQAQAQDDAALVEEAVFLQAGAAVAAGQVCKSSSSTLPASDLLPTAA